MVNSECSESISEGSSVKSEVSERCFDPSAGDSESSDGKNGVIIFKNQLLFMPLVKIELKEGHDLSTLLKMKELVMDAVINTLKLPNDDRNIRICEYKSELFSMKKSYEILVEITLFSGRTAETKKKLYQQIVGSLEEEGICSKENIFIVLNEQPLQNWGIRGGIPANEIELNFKVEI
jgi:phenylpyruvate tautomerase PptA (4-oxalocrotonate tautomerase family)